MNRDVSDCHFNRVTCREKEERARAERSRRSSASGLFTSEETPVYLQEQRGETESQKSGARECSPEDWCASARSCFLQIFFDVTTRLSDCLVFLSCPKPRQGSVEDGVLCSALPQPPGLATHNHPMG